MTRFALIAGLLLFALGCNTPSEQAKPEATASMEAAKMEKVEPAKEMKAEEMKAEEPAAAPTSAKADPASEGHFGAAFNNQEQATPIGAILKDSDKYKGQVVKVSGRVNSVCTKKGCWFAIQDPEMTETSVRITMKDYGFFVPRDCAGKDAVIEGTFDLKVMTEARRKHLAEDAGKDSSNIKGDVKEFTLVATGVEISKAQ
jgi:hypothetical protein